MSEKECAFCGARFAPRNKRSRFCNPLCADKGKYTWYVPVARESRACGACGRQFLGLKGHLACSQACSLALIAKKRREAVAGSVRRRIELSPCLGCKKAVGASPRAKWRCAYCETLHSRLNRYGITPDDYHRAFRAQGGACAICRTPAENDIALHVDHCHRTGDVRGLLCQPCNHGIGLLKDSPTTLRRALRYLEQRQLLPFAHNATRPQGDVSSPEGEDQANPVRSLQSA